jgi:DNA-binding transcriptional ArsR family regulator
MGRIKRKESLVPDHVSCGDKKHEDRMEALRVAALPESLVHEMVELFKMLADPSRLRILNALSSGELCVMHLSSVLQMSQSAVSHQLASLRASRLVVGRRDGKTMQYRLADDHIGILLATGYEHASERNALWKKTEGVR